MLMCGAKATRDAYSVTNLSIARNKFLRTKIIHTKQTEGLLNANAWRI